MIFRVRRLHTMMHFAKAVTHVRRTCHLWHVLVGSLMVWLIIFVYKFIPSLPSEPTYSQELLGRNFRLEAVQQKLIDVSKISYKEENLIKDVETSINDMKDVDLLLGRATLLIETLKVRLAEKTAQNGNLPSAKHEQLTRKIENSINEIWYLITSLLKKPKGNITTIEEDIIRIIEVISEEQTVHIRRTDKIYAEAQYHAVEEYMSHVEHYYKHLRKHGPFGKKRIYLATDAKDARSNITKKYPEYEIIGDKTFAQAAAIDSRYSGASLRSIIMDVHFLSMTDYLVCTFSSQVCRLAYELMQTRHPDASNWFRSLDDIYYFGEQNEHLQEVLLDHSPQTGGEIELKKGDMVQVAGNHWDGYSKGTNLRTGQEGLYPSFKVKEHHVITEVALNDTNIRLSMIRARFIDNFQKGKRIGAMEIKQAGIVFAP